MQDALHRLLGPHFTFWEFVAVAVALSYAWSLVRRFRWSRQHTEVNKVARNMSALPLDRLPLERDQLRSFDFPLALGAFHNIVSASANGHEIVLFDTEVAHPHSEPTLQTMAAFRLLGSPLPDFTLQPKNVLGGALTLLGKSVDFPGSGFSRDYFLTSRDEAGTRACFTPEFHEFFEGLERFDSNKNWHLQKRGEWVIAYRKGEGVEPDELQTFLQGTAEIVRNLEAGTAKEGAAL